MATSGGVRVSGLRRLIAELEGLGLDVQDLKGAMAAVAAEGARYAAGFAPRRSGALAQSVRGNRGKNRAVVAAGRAAVRYAGPINYGWPKRNIAASGFMQKADMKMRPRALRLLEAEIRKSIVKRGLA